MTPLISIALPVYNGEKYVGEAIKSVLEQNYENLELIVSDNASTDSTADICRKYSRQDKRIKYSRNLSNMGAARNFNKAFALSRGKYFKWLAADESIEPAFLDETVAWLEENPEDVLVSTKYLGILRGRADSRKIIKDLSVKGDTARIRFARLVKDIVAEKGNLPIFGLIRREALLETSLIRGFIGADDCLLVELGFKGKFGHVPKYLHLARRHNDSFTDMIHDNDFVEGVTHAKWFDPDFKSSFVLPHWRRIWEYLKIAAGSKESAGDKAAMTAIVMSTLPLRWRKILLKELLYACGMKKPFLQFKKLLKSSDVQ